MKIHPRMALGAKLLLTAIPLWVAAYLIYLTIMGIFGGSDNVGIWFLGGIVLLLESLAFGLLAFGLVTALWQSPREVLRQLSQEWWAAPAGAQGRTLDVSKIDLNDEDAGDDPFMDSPRVNMEV